MAAISAKEWREAYEQGVELVLPSGNTAAIRPVSIDLFIRLSRQIDTLTPIVDRLIKTGTVDINEDTSLDERLQYADMLGLFSRACFVTPKIAPPDREPHDDEITLDMVTLEDRQFVFSFLGQPAKALRNFRQIQAEPLEYLRALEGNEPSTERIDADQPMGSDNAGDAS